MDFNVIFSKQSPLVTETSQRASKLAEHLKSELSPGGQLLPPIGDLVELLGVGQQHLLRSLPQVHGAVSVSQDEPVRSNSKKKYKGKFREPVHHVGGVEGLHQPLLTEPFEARHHIEVCRVHQQLNLVGS